MPYLMNLKVKVGGSKFAKSLIPVDRSASCDINNAFKSIDINEDRARSKL